MSQTHNDDVLVKYLTNLPVVLSKMHQFCLYECEAPSSELMFLCQCETFYCYGWQ